MPFGENRRMRPAAPIHAPPFYRLLSLFVLESLDVRGEFARVRDGANGVKGMAFYERDSKLKERRWRDLALSMAVVGALAAGLLLSGCASAIPDVAKMFKYATESEPSRSDENLVNKGYQEIKAGNYAYAKIYLDSALLINPSNPFAQLNVAVV